MRQLSIVVAVVVLGACGKDSTETKPAGGSPPVVAASAGSANVATGSAASGSARFGFDHALGELEQLKTKMCACADKACSDSVQADFKAWRRELKTRLIGQRPDKVQDETGNTLDRELKACREKHEAGSASGSAASVSAATGSAALTDKFELALVELAGFKTRMCACVDKACADPVQAELKVWKRGLKPNVAERPSKDQDERGNAIDKEMRACRKKAETGIVVAGSSASEKLESVLVAMTDFKTRMCACKDKPCGTQVQQAIGTWAQAASKDLADLKPTPEQDAKGDKIQGELAACQAALK